MPRSSVESRGHHRRSTAAAARFAVMGVAVAAVAGASDVGTRCPAVRLCRGARIQGAHAARASKVLARDSPQKVCGLCARGAPKVINETTPRLRHSSTCVGMPLVRALVGRTPSRAASRVGNGPGDSHRSALLSGQQRRRDAEGWRRWPVTLEGRIGRIVH